MATSVYVAIMEYLQTISDLTDIIPPERIQPIAQRKTHEKPFIVVRRLSRTDSQDLSGNTSYSEIDTFEIDVICDITAQGDTASEIIRQHLDGYQQQNMGSSNPVYIGSVRYRNAYNFFNQDQTGQDAYGFHFVNTFDFGYLQDDNVV